jgi:hypothetical protein
MKNTIVKSVSLFAFFDNKHKLLVFILIIWIANPVFAQKSNWYLFQPNNQGVNVAFTNSGSSQGSNYFKPLKPYSNEPFTNYLSVNSQTDARGKILFYVLSTMDSVYLFNSNNVCVKVFAGYDISPTIVPLPGGIRYHLIVGTKLYWFGLRDLAILNNDVFDFQNATVNGLVKINVSAQDPKYVSKRAVKIIKYSCDTFIYRLYSLEANYAGNTGRYVQSRDILAIGGLVSTNTNQSTKQIHHVSNDNNHLIDVNLEYSISEMELSPNQNELLFSGGSCLLRVDVSGSQFGSATRTCFNSNTITNDSNRFFCGIEYITDTLILLSQFQTDDSTSVNQGMYLFDKFNNTFTKIANSWDFKYSYIESGIDGKLYVSKGDGLYKYDKNSNTISRVIQLSLVPCVPFLNLLFNELNKPLIRVFYLPSAIGSYYNETLNDYKSVIGSYEIKSPKIGYKQTYSNSSHNITPKGSGEILILDSLIITNIAKWVVFDSMTIQFAEGAFLRIVGGSNLELKGTTLMGACGNMWNGVEILQNGTMSSTLICRKNSQLRRTIVRDALIGVKTRSSKHGIITSDSTLFIANKVSMQIENALTTRYNITNTFFIDSVMLNNGDKSEKAIFAKYSALKIGHKDSLPVVVVGGLKGIEVKTSKRLEIQNCNFFRTKNEALELTSIEAVNINNTKIHCCMQDKRDNGAILIDAFQNLIFKRNIVIHHSLAAALLIKPTIGSTTKIGGSILDSNRIVFNDGPGILVNIDNKGVYLNSKVNSFEDINRPVIFSPYHLYNLSIENNQIIGKGYGIGICIQKNVQNFSSMAFLDTLNICHNKLDVQNGIEIMNINTIEQNKILPIYFDWQQSSAKRHVSNNRITLKQYNPYMESVGIDLKNTDHLYCLNNKISNSSLGGISSASNYCRGVRLTGASNSLLYNDSLIGLYGGVEINDVNYFSNIYCNYFFYNFNAIKLRNSKLRLKYSNLPSSFFNHEVHGMKWSTNYIARSNTFQGFRFNGSIFQNDKLTQPDYCKWILESSIKSNPYLLSSPKKRDFVFNLSGVDPCGQFLPNPNALDNKNLIDDIDLSINPVGNFWNEYFNKKYNVIHAKSIVNSSFIKDLIALEFAIDTGSLSQIHTSFFNLNATDTIQDEIKRVFGYWVDYLSHTDTFFQGDGKVMSNKVWDDDSTWHVANLVVDTLVFHVNYKSLPDSAILFLETISRFSPFNTRPSSFFARHLLSFAGVKNGFVDSFYLDLVPITGRVTSNCFGGGTQGLTVKLFDEFHNNTGIYATTEAAGYFRFSGEELKNLDTSKEYYVRVYLPTDSNHISVTAKIAKLQNDSLLNIDCVFPGPPPLGTLFGTNPIIQVEPNPADDILLITGLENHMVDKIVFYNALGSLVMSNINIDDYNSKMQIDVSGLMDGMYYIRIESKGKFFTSKLILQH